MNNFGILVIGSLIVLTNLFMELDREMVLLEINTNHAETLSAIETSTQIEGELIDAVNSAIEHIDAGNEVDCSAVADFIKGFRNAKINRGVDG